MAKSELTHPSALLRELSSDVLVVPEAVGARLRTRLAPAILAATGGHGASSAAAFKAPWRRLRPIGFAVAVPASVLLGALGHAWFTPALRPQPPMPTSATAHSRGATAPVVASGPALETTSPTPTAVVATPTRALRGATPTHPAGSPSGSTTPLAADSVEGDLPLLERARSQLAEGKPEVTLQLLRAHEQRYPGSALAQEREALAVRALVAAGRRSDAERRAALFVAHYPQSMLRASVERAVGKNP